MDSPEKLRLPVAAPPSPAEHHGSQHSSQERQLEALNEIARIATLDLELRPMLQRITDALARHFDWQLVALVNRRADGFVCEAVTTTVPTRVHVGYSRPLGTGVVGEVVKTMQPILIDDVRLHANFVDTTDGVLSEICVPVKHKGALVGVLNIESTRLAAFRGQLPLLETVADQIAGAIASARMYEELKARARLLEMMSDVSRTALEAENLQEFLIRVVNFVRETLSPEIVSIRLYDAARKEYVRAADAGIDSHQTGDQRWPVSMGVIGRAFRTGETQLVRDVTADPDYIMGNPTVVAELVVPIRLRGELLGVFNVETSSTDMFRDENVLAFESIAHQIAGALHLFRTNEELREARRGQQEANINLARMVEKYEDISAHDRLTGLHNRLHFDSVFPVEWRRAARTRFPLSLLVADIDAFKAYNDAHGHLAGDECLKAVATAIAQTVHRAGDVVVRYGGEEFAILLPHTDSDAARVVAETIRHRVASLGIHNPTVPGEKLTISIGVATAIPDGDERNSTSLVDAADRALYAAKRSGRNRVVVRQ
jgi:diguanylate cyclase (GGDEF)-like protein